MCRLPKQGSKVGKYQPWNIYMHAVLWNTSESWSTHFLGKVYNFRHMASRASCFYAKYVEKKWASKTTRQPTQLVQCLVFVSLYCFKLYPVTYIYLFDSYWGDLP